MLLEILWTLEGFATEVALVWLEWNMDAHVRCDVVALDSRGTACTPLAGEVQVVCRLAADVTLADVVLVCVLVACRIENIDVAYIEGFRRSASLAAANPLTSE